MPAALLFSDGGSRGNPGPAGAGFVLTKPDGVVITSGSEALGITTNNIAEYTALIRGLEAAQRKQVTELSCYLDSELIVKQLSGEYRVKKPELKPLFAKVRQLAAGFASIEFTHIPREQNKEADRLANVAMDSATL